MLLTKLTLQRFPSCSFPKSFTIQRSVTDVMFDKGYLGQHLDFKQLTEVNLIKVHHKHYLSKCMFGSSYKREPD